jgi:hypothetical protein
LFNAGGLMKLPWFWGAVMVINVALFLMSAYMLVVL